MTIDAANLYFETLNHQVRCTGDEEVLIDHCCGQRFIGAGSRNKHIVINGTPGNALGCYLNGTMAMREMPAAMLCAAGKFLCVTAQAIAPVSI